MRKGWSTKVVEQLRTGKTSVFTRQDLKNFFEAIRYRLEIPRSVSAERFIETLSEVGYIKVLEIPSEANETRSYRSFVRYVAPDASAFDVALSLRSGSYLSHGSAAYLHGLIRRPEAIYVNKEQSPKPIAAGSLSQEAIDRAFSNEARTSQYVFRAFDESIVLLSGKHTGDFEVIEHTPQGNNTVRCTSLERTLFDMAVRPIYSGGVSQVIRAYRGAGERISLKRLLEVIKRIEHSYPYHQAVGYYMTRAGFSASQLKQLKQLGMQFKFHLENKMKNPLLDREWNVYVPRGVT